jgi:hypothetical protein
MASLIGAGVIFASLNLSVQLGSRLRRSNQATVARFMAVIVASKGMLFVPAGLGALLLVSAAPAGIAGVDERARH